MAAPSCSPNRPRRIGPLSDIRHRPDGKAAKVIDVPWDIAVGADLRYPEVVGPRSAKVNFINSYVAKLHIAAQRHATVGRAFLSVANLMAPPTRLFSPAVVARVLWSGRDSTKPLPAPRPMPVPVDADRPELEPAA
jgi:hypothetical protein